MLQVKKTASTIGSSITSINFFCSFPILVNQVIGNTCPKNYIKKSNCVDYCANDAKNLNWILRWIFSIGIEVKLENAERFSKLEYGFDLGPREKMRLREMLLSYEEKVYGNNYEILTENCQEFLCD